MSYSPDSLSVQVGRKEGERSFVWLQDEAFDGAHLDITTLAAFEKDGGFTESNTRRYEATVAPVRMRAPFCSCRVRVSDLMPDTYVYHAGTKFDGDKTVTAGGRVLGVTSFGKDVAEAAANAYKGLEKIKFEGMHFRRDIGITK